MKLLQPGFRSSFSPVIILSPLFVFLQLSTLASAQQLTATPAAIRFGKVLAGKTKVLPITLTNNGTSGVTVKSVNNSPPFSVTSPSLPLKLAAGQSAPVEITFAPTSLGQTIASIGFISNASNNPLDVPVRGAGVTEWALTANPASLAFGNVQAGSSSTLPIAVTNSGTSEITISQNEVIGTGFSVSGLDLPLNLAPGQSYTFSASFIPQSSGPASGVVWVTNPHNTIVKIFLTGVGTAAGQLTIAPANIDFGKVVDGSRVSVTGTLAASGASVTISSASSSNSEFGLSGLSFPLKLAAGQSVPFTIAFSPQNTGAVSANLAFSSNASSAPTAALSGTGIAPYKVSLSWDASTSSVAGYNVYRGGNTGGPYNKIFNLNLNTSYTDTTVASGNTYYYVTTAVNSSGQESTYSNQVKAVIP